MTGRLPFETKKRTVLTRSESKTNPKYGKDPKDRTVKELIQAGVICINKPSGPTSHQTADFVKRILKTEKCGHGGSLDPKVTGVLPVACNKATKIMQTLLLAGKEYVCLMYLHEQKDKKTIESNFKKFIGKITQLPPVRSAVKRQERKREIYYIDILEIDNQHILFRAGTQAGTYIRKLCSDFGKELGIGSHMAQLVRTKAGPFNDKEIYSLHDLKDAFTLHEEGNDKEIKKIIKPVEYAVSHLPKVWILDTAVDAICHGASLKAPGIAMAESDIKRGHMVAIYSLKNELVAFGQSQLKTAEMMLNPRGTAVKLKTVIMERGTYPKN